MAKRDIKARRWERRKIKRTYNLIRHNYQGYLKQEGMGDRMLICGRQFGKAQLTRLIVNLMSGNTDLAKGGADGKA